MTRRGWLLAVLLPICLSACDSTPGSGSPVVPAGSPGATVTVGLDGRPFKLHLPMSYHTATTLPLVVLLHGYTSSAAEAETYFNLTAESDRRGFLYAMPDGTKNPQGERFWNASDACCNFYGSSVDDSGYLLRLINTVKSGYSVDAGRVFVVGHSNGGFMAYRMACDHPAAVAAIVSLAGAAPNDPARCAPARPVNVLQIQTRPSPSTAAPTAGSDTPRWRPRSACGDASTAVRTRPAPRLPRWTSNRRCRAPRRL